MSKKKTSFVEHREEVGSFEFLKLRIGEEAAEASAYILYKHFVKVWLSLFEKFYALGFPIKTLMLNTISEIAYKEGHITKWYTWGREGSKIVVCVLLFDLQEPLLEVKLVIMGDEGDVVKSRKFNYSQIRQEGVPEICELVEELVAAWSTVCCSEKKAEVA